MAGFIIVLSFIGTIGGAILINRMWSTYSNLFAPVLSTYLSRCLEMDLERRRAEHEAKIKLIKGLD